MAAILFGSIAQSLVQTTRVGQDAQLVVGFVAQLFSPLDRKLPAQLHVYASQGSSTRDAYVHCRRLTTVINLHMQPLEREGKIPTYGYSTCLLVFILSISSSPRVRSALFSVTAFDGIHGSNSYRR